MATEKKFLSSPTKSFPMVYKLLAEMDGGV